MQNLPLDRRSVERRELASPEGEQCAAGGGSSQFPATGGSLYVERRELASPEREERAAEGGSLQFRQPEGA